jgi:GTP-binding protein
MVESFLERHRGTIALAIVLVDARHEPSELDRTMLTWLVDRDIPRLVVGVKADKRPGTTGRKPTGPEAGVETADDGVAPFLVSAVTGYGMKQLWHHVDGALAAYRESNR